MKIFAHRGYSAVYPENTMLAFHKAVEAGADGFELDVKLTRDGVPIIMHDSSVDRTTNGSGNVCDMSLSQIKALDAGIRKGMSFENEPVPTLREVFEEFGNKIMINVELTNYERKYSPALPTAVAQMIRNYGLDGSVIISSFIFKNLVVMKEHLPEIPCGLLAQPGLKGFYTRKILSHSLNVNALHPHFSDVTELMVRQEHQCGRQVRTYTVNTEADVRHMQALGVDAIFADDPTWKDRL